MNEIDGAAGAIAAIDTEPAMQNASDMADAFEAASERIARSLESAARRGELSFESLAQTVARDLARLALSDLIEAPLNALIDGFSKTIGGSSPGGLTTINLNLSGATDPDGFRRSEGQIAATLARAVSLGQQRI